MTAIWLWLQLPTLCRKSLSKYRVFISEPGDDFNDFIFLSSQQPLDLNAKGLLAEQSDWLKARSFNVDKNKGHVLTDDFNPLEHLQTAKAERILSCTGGYVWC